MFSELEGSHTYLFGMATIPHIMCRAFVFFVKWYLGFGFFARRLVVAKLMGGNTQHIEEVYIYICLSFPSYLYNYQ